MWKTCLSEDWIRSAEENCKRCYASPKLVSASEKYAEIYNETTTSELIEIHDKLREFNEIIESQLYFSSK